MTLEFALRSRLRIEEDIVPPPRPRVRLPAVALPIAAYWLATGVLTYTLMFAAEAEQAPQQKMSELRSFASPPIAEPSLPIAEPSLPIAEPSLPIAEPLPSAEASLPLPESSPPIAEQSGATAIPDPAPAPEEFVRSPFPTAPRPSLSFRRSDPTPRLSRQASSASVGRRERIPELPIWPAPLEREIEEAESREDRSAAVPSPTPARESPRVTALLPSCETVMASSNQDVDLAAPRTAPDLPREAFASILDNGAYLSACAIPERTALDICVAVQEGKAKGITVSLRPPDAGISACVRRAVAALRFRYSPRLDIARTRFNAVVPKR
jgi:hypothetical protein